jgi:chromosome partitioning protein
MTTSSAEKTSARIIDKPRLFARRELSPDLIGNDAMVISRELKSRPIVDAHIIVFANEKGGVGKSTAAFHTCIALCNAGNTITAIDLDHRQQSLSRALENREGTSRRLKIDLPQPRYATVNQPTPAMLAQEIARIGGDADFIVIDVAGHDSPMARRAIAMADTLVTPINNSFVDIDLLGRYDAITHKLKSFGPFARLVQDLREVRDHQRQPPFDWIVMPNRTRHIQSHNQERVADALSDLAPKAGFRIAAGLGERVAYRDLFLMGLTLLDLKYIPAFAKAAPVAKAEITHMIAELKLPIFV